MTKIQVDAKVKDVGPSGASEEHFQHNVNLIVMRTATDWFVDTATGSIKTWNTNATVKGVWAASLSVYTGADIGNLTTVDFSYPGERYGCSTHICEDDDVSMVRHAHAVALN